MNFVNISFIAFRNFAVLHNYFDSIAVYGSIH